MKELEKLVYCKVMKGKDAKSLSPKQKNTALKYLVFLKEKQSAFIKGQGCRDSRKQRAYKTKEETSSPTVTTESIFLTCLIDAAESQCIAMCDISGAFM